MTIAPTRPAGAQLNRDQAKVLAHYASGESASSIVTNTGFDMAFVGAVLDEHAGNDRGRAHRLVLEYKEHAQTVAAAKGGPTPAAAAAGRVVPAPPAKARARTGAADKPAVPVPAPAPEPEPEQPAAEPAAAAVKQPAVDVEPAADAAKQATDQPGGPGDEIAVLLQAAEDSGVAQLVKAAAKIRDLVGELRGDLEKHTRETELRAEAALLEARLAAIKLELRPRRASVQQTPPPADEDQAEADAKLDSKAVRAWAAQQGIECNSHGRIPRSVVDAYQAAVAR